jgi:hypothetical protein
VHAGKQRDQDQSPYQPRSGTSEKNKNKHEKTITKNTNTNKGVEVIGAGKRGKTSASVGSTAAAPATVAAPSPGFVGGAVLMGLPLLLFGMWLNKSKKNHNDLALQRKFRGELVR